jgi:hypothetical protein
MHALNMSDCESLFFIMCIVLRTGIGKEVRWGVNHYSIY